MAMKSLMNHFREKSMTASAAGKFSKKRDYMEETGLPKADVVEFILEGGARFIIRPSGTEAKIKVYLFETENNTKLEKAIEHIIETYKEL